MKEKEFVELGYELRKNLYDFLGELDRRLKREEKKDET